MSNNPAELQIPVRTHSKDEIIKILKEENPTIEEKEKYIQLMCVFEVKKIQKDLGIFKGEYYKSDKLEYRGSLLIPLSKQLLEKPSVWDDLNESESKIYGFTFDSRESTVLEKISAFVKRSFEDKAIQDFVPFIKK